MAHQNFGLFDLRLLFVDLKMLLFVFSLDVLSIDQLAVLEMPLVWFRHERPLAVRTMNHPFIFETTWRLRVKFLYLLKSPVFLVVNDFYFFLREGWRLFSFRFIFLLLLYFEFLKALRVMNLQAEQSELSSAYAAHQSPRFFYNFLSIIILFFRLFEGSWALLVADVLVDL